MEVEKRVLEVNRGGGVELDEGDALSCGQGLAFDRFRYRSSRP